MTIATGIFYLFSLWQLVQSPARQSESQGEEGNKWFDTRTWKLYRVEPGLLMRGASGEPTHLRIQPSRSRTIGCHIKAHHADQSPDPQIPAR